MSFKNISTIIKPMFRVAKLISNPNFIPLFIPDEDLVHLPPVRIFGAEHDVLKNDAQIFYGMVL